MEGRLLVSDNKASLLEIYTGRRVTVYLSLVSRRINTPEVTKNTPRLFKINLGAFCITPKVFYSTAISSRPILCIPSIIRLRCSGRGFLIPFA